MQLSYSALNTYLQCPQKFKLIYIDKNFSKTSNLALDLGKLCHKAMEDKILNRRGFKENFVNGFEFLRKKYPDKILEYQDKYSIFIKRLEIPEEKLNPLNVERYFSLNFGKHTIKGYIDILLINKDNEYILKDYKTNKDLFKTKELDNSLQLGIYALAIESLFGKLPIRLEYDMLFHNTIQSSSFDKQTILNKINNILDGLDMSLDFDMWSQKSSILCYWCSYYKDSINFDFMQSGLCSVAENVTISKYKKKVGGENIE